MNVPDQPLTTNQGVKINDNQNTLKAGARGATLLEDFIMREKITHFDHEGVPERLVHARGTAAHGYLELTDSLKEFTKPMNRTRLSSSTKRSATAKRLQEAARAGNLFEKKPISAKHGRTKQLS